MNTEVQELLNPSQHSSERYVPHAAVLLKTEINPLQHSIERYVPHAAVLLKTEINLNNI